MKKHIPFYFLLLFYLVSCNNNWSETPPEIPDTLTIDVDDDGQVDFVLEYFFGYIFATDGDEQITGSFHPEGNNLVLHKTDHQNLFLRDVSEISEIVEEPLFWNDKGWSEEIIAIQNNTEGLWPPEWELKSEDDHDTYFIGLKFASNNEIKVGWVELEFNVASGEAILVNKAVL